MSDVDTKTIYLVQKWHWRARDDSETVGPDDPRADVQPRPYREGEWRLVTYQREPDEGGLPVRAFRDYARAEAFRREQEESRRSGTNPFRYGWNMVARTSLDEGRLRDWLLDAGLTPPGREGELKPKKVRAAWRAWWKKLSSRLKEKEQLAIAQALSKALAGQGEEDEGAAGQGDLAWLDDRLGRMDELTAEQRYNCWMGLIGLVTEWPARDGEQDYSVMEATWRDWWDREREAMTPYQRQQVWEALDKVRFFEIVELQKVE